MPAQSEYDVDEIRNRLARWLAGRLPDARGLTVGEIGAPGDTGFSSETLFVEASWRSTTGSPESARWVIRSVPSRYPVFPVYDLHAQYRCMQLVAEHSDVPVPRVRWWEPDESHLGSPFYVMDRVDGDVPSDSPPYTLGGFLFDAAPEDQERLCREEIGLLAQLHAIDWRKAGFDFLDRKEFGSVGLEQQFGYFENFLQWAARGRPQPTVEAAFAWIKANRPQGSDEVVLNWGDARPSNIITRGLRPVAVLDWEMATLGPPECDLGWFVYLNRFLSEGVGVPPLPGFLDEQQCVAEYESASGRRVHDLHYYQVWTGLRFAIIFIRIIQGMDLAGTLPPDWTEDHNMVTLFLAKVAGLPSPEPPTNV